MPKNVQISGQLHSFHMLLLVLLLLLLSRFSHVRLCATPETAATRLPRPWDSPGKNTGVGCHFLLQCMEVKSESEVAQSCPTLRDPMDCSRPGSSVHGIFQAKVLEWVPFGSSQCKSSRNLCLLSVKAKNRGMQILLGALLPFPV